MNTITLDRQYTRAESASAQIPYLPYEIEDTLPARETQLQGDYNPVVTSESSDSVHRILNVINGVTGQKSRGKNGKPNFEPQQRHNGHTKVKREQQQSQVSTPNKPQDTKTRPLVHTPKTSV